MNPKRLAGLAGMSAWLCVLATPASAQFNSLLQHIDVQLLDTTKQVTFTLSGQLPASCLELSPTPSLEDGMVTIDMTLTFPEGVKACTRESSPFTVDSRIDMPPPGDYEVQVLINGEMQVPYRQFHIEASST